MLFRSVEFEEVKFLKSLFEMNVEEVCGVDSWTQKFEELPESRGLTLPSSVQPPTLE